MVKEEFTKAFKKVYQEGELDKMLNEEFDEYLSDAAILKAQRDDIRALKETIDAIIADGNSIEDIPFMLLLTGINSAEVFKDVILYMMYAENEVKNENE